MIENFNSPIFNDDLRYEKVDYLSQYENEIIYLEIGVSNAINFCEVNKKLIFNFSLFYLTSLIPSLSASAYMIIDPKKPIKKRRSGNLEDILSADQKPSIISNENENFLNSKLGLKFLEMLLFLIKDLIVNIHKASEEEKILKLQNIQERELEILKTALFEKNCLALAKLIIFLIIVLVCLSKIKTKKVIFVKTESEPVEAIAPKTQEILDKDIKINENF